MEVNNLIFLEVPYNASEVLDLLVCFIHTLVPYFFIGVPDNWLTKNIDIFEDGFMG